MGEEDRLRINIAEIKMYNDSLSGSQIINMKANLELSENVQIHFGDSIEISLDCFICLARRRTIKISENQEEGICIKTKHPFPIKINSTSSKLENNQSEIIYQIEYWYSPFFDRKHNKESQFLPTWGRINFRLICSKCSGEKAASLQTNIIRPWTNYCECGQPFYTEKEVFPLFEIA